MGGISCIECYPPKKPEHVLLRLVSEGGVWTTPDQAFYIGCDNLGNSHRSHSPDVTSPPQAETGRTGPRDAASRRGTPGDAAEPSTDHQQTIGRSVVRRKSSEPYAAAELAWVVCCGGILDQMAESVRLRKIPVCRSGETADEVVERLLRFRNRSAVPRRIEPSNLGAVPAKLTTDLRFVGTVVGPEFFPAGSACLLFPGRIVSERDPEAGDIRASLAGRGKEGKRMSVIRLPADGGRLRILDEGQVIVV